MFIRSCFYASPGKLRRFQIPKFVDLFFNFNFMIMKNLKYVFACFFLIMLGLGSFAENATDYFVGKWNVQVSGTPNGDSKMVVSLAKNSDKLEGSVDMGQGEPIKFTQIETTNDSVKLYFNAGGYDIFLLLKKKDEAHIDGTMMDMFDAKGERVIENK